MATSAPPTSCSASPTAKKCFNSECSEFRIRKGWRLRSGDFADLCDRCASTFEEGRFCDTFHLNATGWRSCESCGKRVHCGCIVSIHAFMLLDAGGIECIGCARKSFVPPSTPWPPPLYYNTPLSERFKDLHVKNWTQLAGSGPVPWRQAPSLFNSSVSHCEMHPRTLYEMDRLAAGERSYPPSLEKGRLDDFSERFINGSLKPGSRDIHEKGNAGANVEEKAGSCLSVSHQPSSLREDPSNPQRTAMSFASLSEPNNGVSGTPIRQPAPPSVSKPFHGSLHNGVDSPSETHIRNGRPRADARARSQLLPRYWPRFTDEELQQISGNSNSVITPLFEKMLSASDAGRIGRLVLPKKCAEAYFPPISNPEGLPLKVQDSKGREWIFQFRFWPNNNSRMYVLEGVTPCIQNMRLQAGDIVTFSRLEPEGKLVMGFRKTSNLPSSDQDNDTCKTGNGVSTNGDAELADSTSWSKADKSGCTAKEVLEAKSSTKKRKSSTLGSKSKRLRIENEDMLELKLTWEEAQGLLRPPPDHVPSVVVIEGFEFEEYEDAPIIGKPTIFATDNSGEKVQWVRCEYCFKWRKLPANADLPFKWTCAGNSWDPDRSLCSAGQELTTEQLADLLPSCNLAGSKKMKAVKQETENVEVLEGLDALANLAILGENEAFPTSSQATTKHPRHRPGCSCIVCIQPPSGKGPKHKQTCTCNVCQTVKRRFKTLMMKREKKQSEKDAETTKKKPQQSLHEKLPDDEASPSGNSSSPNKKLVGEGSDDDPNRIKSSTSPFKGQIDLNIQPEREDELSPGSDSGSTMKMIQDATERYLRQQRFLSSDGDNISAGKQTLESPSVVDRIDTINAHQDSDKDRPITLSTNVSPSSPAAG
ncbi:B3 domain-containing protein Os07g0563300 [Mercurialis annua]|uniref:B3 domain-containing protein Os07g0563300 n=1 Tax=Mercurialis annua TaxID=3986 RepID=UPI00215E378E|nr:B3 domain-containing protein Os07g0563300 [Mercurialis annua]